MAKVTFNYGAMDSGKSLKLLSTAHQYQKVGDHFLTMKPGTDTRDHNLRSRTGLERDLDMLIDPSDDIRERVSSYMAARAINQLAAIITDESQFFQPEQVDQLYDLAKNQDISIIAFGLRTDFQSHLFPGSQRFLELADRIMKVESMCHCGSQSEFNTRKVNGMYVFQGDQVAIDGSESTSYDSLCGKCYLTEKAKTLATPSPVGMAL